MQIHYKCNTISYWKAIQYNMGYLFWTSFWQDPSLNVTFLSRQTEFGHNFGSWGKAWTSPFTTIQNYVQTRSDEKVLSSQKKVSFFSLSGLDPESRFRNLLLYECIGLACMVTSGLCAGFRQNYQVTLRPTMQRPVERKTRLVWDHLGISMEYEKMWDRKFSKSIRWQNTFFVQCNF